jgi:SDR family mycofactocin-dependent oxidoreductase
MGVRLDGKVAVITGAARGIGRACAVRMAEEGADLVLVDLAAGFRSVLYPAAKMEELEQTAGEVRALGRQALVFRVDVTDGLALQSAVNDAVDHYGGIDVLVAAAGIDSWGNAWELSDEQWQAMLDVNLTGVWQSAKALTPHMMARRSGAMIFIGSVLSHRANRQFAHYTAAKHGVLGLTRAFALELAPSMIRVNSVDPTVVNTPMVMNPLYIERFVGRPGATVEDAASRYLEWNTMPVPWIEPVDVANAVLFLASDEARYITGVSLPVDLGALLR